MTDLLDTGEAPTGPQEPWEDEPGPDVPPASLRVCQYEGCGNALPLTAHGRQIYCEDHKGGRPAPGTPRVNVQIGASRPSTRGSTKDKQLAAVEARAEQLMTTMAAVVLLSGHQDDALSMQNGAKLWAQSVRGLAEYEEWLRKLAAGGDTSGRAMAWLQFLIATASIALPILINHGALPDNIASFAAQFIGSMPPDMGDSAGGPVEPAAEPQPAAA